MAVTTRNRLTDVRGASALAFDATAGVVGLVEAMHDTFARLPLTLAGPLVGGAVNGITRLVYRTVHGVTRVAGGGIDVALAPFAGLLGDVPSWPGREAVVAALNGVLGDHLAASGNPLAITMRLRHDGAPLELSPRHLAAVFPRASARIVVLVHGLCMNDLQWTRRSHCHGRALGGDLGYTPVYLHYNTGRHVSTNGRALADLLEALVASWPVPVEELAIVGHSMGGLVARSAQYYGTVAGHGWTRRVRKLVFLGTPHHGAALERAGHRVHRLVERTPYAAPLARLGKIRSAGITDLRHGSLRDEDWQGRDRFAHGSDTRQSVPLPEDVRCFTIAATRGKSAGDLRSRVAGDGLVPLASALGVHRDPQRTLAFPGGHQWIAYDAGHFDLLDRAEVYARIRDWLSDAPLG